jgi:hypothetical protein
MKWMALIEDEETFLSELVKESRQKIHLVKWVDRDGTNRQTALTPAAAGRLNGIAHRQKTSMGAVLREAAHVPVKRKTVGSGEAGAVIPPSSPGNSI